MALLCFALLCYVLYYPITYQGSCQSSHHIVFIAFYPILGRCVKKLFLYKVFYSYNRQFFFLLEGIFNL